MDQWLIVRFYFIHLWNDGPFDTRGSTVQNRLPHGTFRAWERTPSVVRCLRISIPTPALAFPRFPSWFAVMGPFELRSKTKLLRGDFYATCDRQAVDFAALSAVPDVYLFTVILIRAYEDCPACETWKPVRDYGHTTYNINIMLYTRLHAHTESCTQRLPSLWDKETRLRQGIRHTSSILLYTRLHTHTHKHKSASMNKDVLCIRVNISCVKVKKHIHSQTCMHMHT